MRDFLSNVAISQLIDPANTTADVDGSSIDLLGYGSALIVVSVGETGDTLDADNYIELELEESDNDSTFTDVDDADLRDAVDGTNDGTFALINAADEDDSVYFCQYTGSKRYVRPVINVTGTHSTGTPIGAIGIRGLPKYPPVN